MGGGMLKGPSEAALPNEAFLSLLRSIRHGHVQEHDIRWLRGDEAQCLLTALGD
jgi:hypothetical protein